MISLRVLTRRDVRKGLCMISRDSFRSGDPVMIGMHPYERGM
jgi:hypothetical protein